MRFPLALMLLLTSVPVADAAIVFNFSYLDTTIGFNDPTLGATRRATVNAVASYVNSVIDETGVVDITWNLSDNNAGLNTLASMGTSYFLNDGFSNGLVFAHATTGIDPFAGSGDGSGKVNFGHSWNSDLGNPTGSEYDLFSVVLHELTHAMGVASLIRSDGGFAIAGTRSVYDTFLETGGGTPLLNGAGVFTAPVGSLTSGDVFLDLSASGGGVLEVYAPTPYENGSSISHFDTSLGPNVVMQPSIGAGVMRRTYSTQDLAVLRAIGWNVRAVPEPSGMLLVGMVVALGSIRRRRYTRVKQNPTPAACR